MDAESAAVAEQAREAEALAERSTRQLALAEERERLAARSRREMADLNRRLAADLEAGMVKLLQAMFGYTAAEAVEKAALYVSAIVGAVGDDDDDGAGGPAAAAEEDGHLGRFGAGQSFAGEDGSDGAAYTIGARVDAATLRARAEASSSSWHTGSQHHQGSPYGIGGLVSHRLAQIPRPNWSPGPGMSPIVLDRGRSLAADLAAAGGGSPSRGGSGGSGGSSKPWTGRLGWDIEQPENFRNAAAGSPVRRSGMLDSPAGGGTSSGPAAVYPGSPGAGNW
jgi:hypothetical protein